jgi:hypothetical protein
MNRTRTGADPKCELYEFGTWAPTPRLQALRKEGASASFTKDELLILWDVYLEGCAEAGVGADMVDFGMWVSGTGPYASEDPATIYW